MNHLPTTPGPTTPGPTTTVEAFVQAREQARNLPEVVYIDSSPPVTVQIAGPTPPKPNEVAFPPGNEAELIEVAARVEKVNGT